MKSNNTNSNKSCLNQDAGGWRWSLPYRDRGTGKKKEE